MKKGTFLSAFLAMVMLFGFSGNVFAADLVTVVHKTFRDFNYPHEEKVVGMEVRTKVNHQEGDRKSSEPDIARRWQAFIEGGLKRHAWKEDGLAVDDVIAKKIEIVIGRRTVIFIHQCELPANEKTFAGSNELDFVEEAIEKMEECLTYDMKLQ
ncbi:hypothetical protein L6270_00030 [Candidatus Parcubacteria bacterium]|nr:hypothetical protein [Patescibacteria group bacterium]MBU4309542.1 hypothetical protein [Patescibacteria group bacterium]MBU4432528.1 hypothetical protein [Patescibacteria group bacterium]MBU4578070.1 hypothetical protein [Patescibacteria group bacterium]MCG2696422.1 hypothetical protein [Candidatus Parcubacteria bacterium]